MSEARPSAKRKMICQFARTVTAQKPLRSPFKGCSPNVGRSSASIVCAACNTARDLLHLTQMIRIDPFGVVIFEQPPQSLVPKALDHRRSRLSSVKYRFTHVNGCFTVSLPPFRLTARHSGLRNVTELVLRKIVAAVRLSVKLGRHSVTIFSATCSGGGSVIGSSPGITAARMRVRVGPGLTRSTRTEVDAVSAA